MHASNVENDFDDMEKICLNDICEQEIDSSDRDIESPKYEENAIQEEQSIGNLEDVAEDDSNELESSEESDSPNDVHENDKFKEESSSHEYLNGLEKALARPYEPWRISSYKRVFPIKKQNKDFPGAAKRTYMEKRRPLWLPQNLVDNEYLLQASYFSEILARDQLRRQAVIDQIYKPNFGEYAYCRSDLVGKTYVSKYHKGVHTVKFSPDGKFLVIGCGNGTIQIRNMRNNNTSVHCIRGFPRKITSIKFLTNRMDFNIFFASSLTGRIYMGRRDKKKWKVYSYVKEIDNEINAMDLNKDSSLMASAGRDSHIRLYDPRRTKLLQIYLRPGTLNQQGRVPDDGHFMRICALKFDGNDANVFVTGGWDNILKVWDQRTISPVQSIPGPHLISNSIDVLGRVILTGQWTCNEGIQLWDMRCGRCLHTVKPLNRPLCYAGEFINGVQFVRSWEGPPITIPGIIGDLILAVGSGTKALEVISVKENMILHSTEEVNAVTTVDHFRSLIAYGSVSHLYGIVGFFPFVGTLSTDMKFKDKETEDEMVKYFSSYGNPLGWHEVALETDFMEAFSNTEEQKKEDLKKKGPKKKVKGTKVNLISLDESLPTYSIIEPK